MRSLARPAERRSPRPEGRRSRRQQSQSQSQTDHDGGAVPPGVVTELGANGLLRKPRLQVAWGHSVERCFAAQPFAAQPSGVPAGPASETEPGRSATTLTRFALFTTRIAVIVQNLHVFNLFASVRLFSPSGWAILCANLAGSPRGGASRGSRKVCAYRMALEQLEANASASNFSG